ncbi:MAG: ATP-binding protein [Candidatus Omnitrophica bacterium]|nr:ATP-binding protein [Candidatus Omnitrophota bacterium]
MALDKAASLPVAGEDAQEEKRHLVARLLSHLAHEIRNPLSALDVHVQLLEEDLMTGDTGLRQRAADRFQIIRAEIRRLENVVTRFLQLAGPSVLEVLPQSLNGLVNQTCDLLEADAQERGIDLRMELAPDLPPVEGDSILLTQALINLVINALQASSANGHVWVRTRKIGTDQVAAEITDDGQGIQPEDQLKIFEPYYTTKPGGNGLGLWITQQVVRAHGGTLRIDSEPGRGSSFILTLPVQHPVTA